MKNVDISNFKKALTPALAGTSDTFEYKLEELSETLEALKEKNEKLMRQSSGEEYINDFKALLREYSTELPSPNSAQFYKWATSNYFATSLSHYPYSIPIEPSETNIDKLLDDLSEKTKMIQMLSTSLKVSDKIFANLLNKLSIGFILFFLLTILICYLKFS